MNALRIVVLGVMLLTVGACSHLSEKEQKMLSGGAIGAAGGAALGLVTGGSWVAGGLIGAAAGTVVGAVLPK